MALSDEQKQTVQAVFDQYDLNPDTFSAWERSFIADNKERWEEYGDDIRLSPKQFAIFQRMYEKI